MPAKSKARRKKPALRLRSGQARKKVKKVKRSARKVMGRKKLVKKVAKKVTRKAIRASVKKGPPAIGKVVHYYDRIGVAVLELASPIRVGDYVIFRRGVKEFAQAVSSLQIEHASVMSASKGQSVGMKVDQAVDRGTKVLNQ